MNTDTAQPTPPGPSFQAAALHTALMLAALREPRFADAASHLADAHLAAIAQPAVSQEDQLQTIRLLDAATLIWNHLPDDAASELVGDRDASDPIAVIDDLDALRIMLRALTDLLDDLHTEDLAGAAEKIAAVFRAAPAVCDLANPDASVVLAFADLIRRHHGRVADQVIRDTVDRFTGPDSTP